MLSCSSLLEALRLPGGGKGVLPALEALLWPCLSWCSQWMESGQRGANAQRKDPPLSLRPPQLPLHVLPATASLPQVVLAVDGERLRGRPITRVLQRGKRQHTFTLGGGDGVGGADVRGGDGVGGADVGGGAVGGGVNHDRPAAGSLPAKRLRPGAAGPSLAEEAEGYQGAGVDAAASARTAESFRAQHSSFVSGEVMAAERLPGVRGGPWAGDLVSGIAAEQLPPGGVRGDPWAGKPTL